MAVVPDAEFRAALGRQALGRSLTTSEKDFALALEAIFHSGEHDLAKAVELLEAKGVKRPSGWAGAWSLDVLAQELARINASLDEAYAANGAALLRGELP
jgi:hypothetical protein